MHAEVNVTQCHLMHSLL